MCTTHRRGGAVGQCAHLGGALVLGVGELGHAVEEGVHLWGGCRAGQGGDQGCGRRVPGRLSTRLGESVASHHDQQQRLACPVPRARARARGPRPPPRSSTRWPCRACRTRCSSSTAAFRTSSMHSVPPRERRVLILIGVLPLPIALLREQGASRQVGVDQQAAERRRRRRRHAASCAAVHCIAGHGMSRQQSRRTPQAPSPLLRPPTAV